MGSMAPYFSVYPLPAKVPTNAAVLASQHNTWTVTVVDGSAPVEVRVERFASMLAIRPVHGWPPDRPLAIVARLDGMEVRHPFETASAPHLEPPSCAWTGPTKIHPKSATPEPDTWPTNIPRPPKHQRMFDVPPVSSPTGYWVAAQVWVKDRRKTAPIETVLLASGPTDLTLTPFHDGEFADDAQIVGLVLTDVAGNTASYGKTT